MPVIRIAEIPNAGPRAVAASNANIGVPRLGGGMAVEARAAQATGAAMMDNSSTQRAAASMLSQTLQQGAFTAEAEAGMRFGAAIGQVGQMFAQFGEKFAAAKDTADLARAETTMRAAFEKQQREQLDLPAEKWRENWERNLNETQKALAEIKFSNNAAERLGPSWERWSELSSIQIEGQVRKKQIEGFRMDVEANAMMKVASEDLAGAIAIYDAAVRDGIFTPEEGNMAKARLRDNEVRKARQENRDRLVAQLNSQPWDMLPLFNARAKGEDVPELGDISPPEAASLAGATKQVIRTQVADMDDDITQRIFNGELSKPEEIDAWAPYLPAQRLAGHKKFLNDKWEASPERWAQVTALRPVLLTEIQNYNPDADDNEWTQYFRIKDMVNHPTEGMPPGEKREFLEMLYAKRRKEGKSQAPAVRQRMTVLNEMYKRGYFGQWDNKKLESKNDKTRNAEWQKVAEAGTKHMEMLDALTTWADQNPDKAADPQQVADFFQRMVSPDMLDAAIDLTDQVIRADEQTETRARGRRRMSAPVAPVPQAFGPGATPAAIKASLPAAKQPIAREIASMAESEGLGQFTPHLMLLVAQESNFNPNQTISTSSARGLFQLLNADRKKFGADSSVKGQIRAGLAKTKENIAAARQVLGRDPDPFELYVVHYQGVGAGPAILRNPNGDFRATLNATGGSGHAARVIKANPWLARLQTNQDFIDWVRQRLSKKAEQLGMA